MAKQTKSVHTAPRTPKIEVPLTEQVEFTPESYSKTMHGLDSNHVVDLLKMQHETFRMDPNASKRYKISQDTVDKINRINAMSQVAIYAQEVTLGNTQFALTMNAAMKGEIQEIARQLEIKIDTTKLLTVNEEEIQIPAEAVQLLQAARLLLPGSADVWRSSAASWLSSAGRHERRGSRGDLRVL